MAASLLPLVPVSFLTWRSLLMRVCVLVLEDVIKSCPAVHHAAAGKRHTPLKEEASPHR